MARAPVADKGRNFALRFVSAFILAGVVVASLFAGPLFFRLLVISVGALSLVEWFRMSRSSLIIGGIGFFYICVAAWSLMVLYVEPENWFEVLFLFSIVWASDSAAYACGKLFGGPRLAPRTSPNKTWTGAAGGLLGPLLLWPPLNLLFAEGTTISFRFYVSVCLMTAVATELGDLLESAAKRHFGVKDSGWIIPGHGGILDRIDGLLLAAPVFLIITTLNRYL